MIDAIKKRSENMEKLKEEHPTTWMELLTYFEIRMMAQDRTELMTEVERLLERALVAEAAEEQLILLGNELSKAYRLADERARRAVARETALVEAGRTLSRSAVAQGKEPAFALDPQDLAEFDSVTENVSPTAAALLERLAKLETQVADLRGTLQAALLPLEAAADALVPPGAMAGLAAGLVEQAIAAIREELE